MTLQKIFEPLTIAGARLPNRVVRTAHATNIGAGRLTDDLVAYHEARARGGVGLSLLEILSVHASSPGPLMIGDDLRAGHERLMDAVAPHGMAVFQQLWHGGHHAAPLDGGPPWSASDIPSPLLGVVPVAMTRTMIDEVVAAYANAARLCEENGLDGVEIHCAHGYLIQQFLSPATNRRQDDYGGSFANRARLLLEVVRATRAAVRPSFAVGVRLSPDGAEGGVTIADNREILRLLQEESLVDFVDVSLGSYYTFPKLIGGMHEPVGYEMPSSSPITAVADVPALVTGRFRTLEEAEQVLRSGEADLVGLTRATIADPDLVAKTRVGQAHRVRPCIACNQGCVGNLMGPEQRMSCVVNPVVGYEKEMGEDLIKPAGKVRNVWVIGGGPAGLEAARVAALRGHRVTLAEAGSRLGGAVLLAARLPTRHGLTDFTHWLIDEIERLGVRVRLNTFMDVDEITGENPDAVIVATGAVPRDEGLQIREPGKPIAGFQQAHVLSTVDLLGQYRDLAGKTVVVSDDVGHYEGLGVSEYLLEKGCHVHLVTPATAIGRLVEPALMTEPALERMAGHGDRFTPWTRCRVLETVPGRTVIAPAYGGEGRAIGADLLVAVAAGRPCRELFDGLQGYVPELAVVGDASSPRGLQAAVREGHRAGRCL
jgi:2,4-dienoyl-CoA reductase-like NADH-dependent reductase (Old Yellow Enzyme family)